MRFRWLAIFSSLMAAVCVAAEPLDRIEKPPTTWRGHVFTPSFNFPTKPNIEAYPWQRISFRKEPERYLRELLAYALDGQDRTHWNLGANERRRWHHMPWLGPGANGREFIHGLTRGRDLAPGELGSAQTACRQNWAIAFYNDAGGAVLGKIWGSARRDPSLNALPFPVGTVAVKIVFTEATIADDPKLAEAPEVQANIHADATPGDANCAEAVSNNKPASRAPHTLRLIQIDLAVREDRASYKTGWVFGSFRYDGTIAGSDPWAKLVPMGLMWGNDPQLNDDAAVAGAKPRQSIVFDAGLDFGRGGRMNGVVDDRSSACSSCHMAAQWPTVAPMTAPLPWNDAKCWFRNLDARYAFGFPPGVGKGCTDTAALAKTQSLDFSLQLAIALRNWSMTRAKSRGPVRTPIGTLGRNGHRLTVNGLESLVLKR